MMVAGGTSLFGEDVSSVEIYDSSLDSWYYSEDLPEEPESYYTHDLISWERKPVWLNGRSIWEFDEGTWYRLDASVTGGYYYRYDFILLVPDDFIPGC